MLIDRGRYIEEEDAHHKCFAGKNIYDSFFVSESETHI